jgi:hypothetical protein
VNRAKIAATIAYTLSGMGFTQAQRLLVAEAFANDLRLTGTPRVKFLNECRTYSEQQALAEASK